MGDMDVDSRVLSDKRKVESSDQRVSFMDIPREAMNYLQSMFKRKRNNSGSEESQKEGKHSRLDHNSIPTPPGINNYRETNLETEHMASYQYMIYMSERNPLD